jgi:hypothetical protein
MDRWIVPGVCPGRTRPFGPNPNIPPCSPFSPEAGNFGGVGAVCGTAAVAVANTAIVRLMSIILAKEKRESTVIFGVTEHSSCS